MDVLVGVLVGGGVPVNVSVGDGVFVGVSVGGGSVGIGDRVGVSVKLMTGVGDGTIATSVASGVGLLVGATVGVTCGRLVPHALAIMAKMKNPTTRLVFTVLLHRIVSIVPSYYNQLYNILTSLKGHGCPTMYRIDVKSL